MQTVFTVFYYWCIGGRFGSNQLRDQTLIFTFISHAQILDYGVTRMWFPVPDPGAPTVVRFLLYVYASCLNPVQIPFKFTYLNKFRILVPPFDLCSLNWCSLLILPFNSGITVIQYRVLSLNQNSFIINLSSFSTKFFAFDRCTCSLSSLSSITQYACCLIPR